MSRENTSLPQAIFDTPRTPSTKTIPAAGGESRQTTFDHLRPGSQQGLAQPQTGHQHGPREDQGRTPGKDTSNQPQKKRKKGPKKAEERPGEAQTGQTSRTPQSPKERPEEATKGHQKPTANSRRRRRSQPATKEPQERPGKAHGRPRTGPAVQDHRPTAEAKERPKKGQRKATTGGRPRAAFGCRVEECRTVSDSKPVVVDTVRETSTCQVW